MPLVLSPVLTSANSPNTLVKSSFTGTLRSDGSGTVSIAPVGSAIVSTSVLDGSSVVSLGTPVGNAQSFAAGVSGTPYTYAGQYAPGPNAGPFAAGPQPVSGFTLMTQNTAFALSAGDRATVVSFSEITPVPEPETYALLLVGLAAMGGFARLRTRRF